MIHPNFRHVWSCSVVRMREDARMGKVLAQLTLAVLWSTSLFDPETGGWSGDLPAVYDIVTGVRSPNKHLFSKFIYIKSNVRK